MATLQKFKLLATQCAVAGSPTRSPSASPVIHLRRRKTLRMLLSRVGGGSGRKLQPPRCDGGSPDRKGSSDEGSSPEKGKELLVGHRLKDLFVSSPPALADGATENVREALLPESGGAGGDLRRGGGARPRRLPSATFRQRLLRRAWRPVLVAIPE
ncbi:hypothetical protein CDL12_24145 [Handroanthus impetiginosus]|uniref:Uncharacterized protein n=1 Tax=Handroanthus impetiginosus TaxID=429701 RepID=A0A2G9GDG6_9LAMI|nr:hypothetical protein CDL12_24145 [Handroanthus impetiginosus]